MNTNMVSKAEEYLTKAAEQTEPIKVVARYNNGKIVKGYSYDFYPNKPIFSIFSNEDITSKENQRIQIKDLKAVFFVKDFTGNPSYNEQKLFKENQYVQGRKIEVTFKDGEVLVGTTVGYTPDRLGFFLFPADAESNNLRVFVVSLALKKIRFL